MRNRINTYWGFVALAWVVWLLAAAQMFLVALPAVVETCGAPALDARLVWTPDAAAQLLADCGVDGRVAYAAQQRLDLVYPVLMAFCLGGFTWLAARKAGWSGAHCRAAVVPAALLLVGDAIENAVVSRLLELWPHLPQAAFVWFGVCGSVLKNVMGVVAWVMALVALLCGGKSVFKQQVGT